jgi:hypothetical protein
MTADRLPNERPEMKKVLSCGAGVQSSTVLLMSCLGELPKLDAAVFADTGWEPPDVYRYLEFLKDTSERHGIPFYVVSAGDIRDNKFSGTMPWYVDTGGDKEGSVQRGCTDRLKIGPVEKKISEIVGRDPGQRWDENKHFYEHWFGISADEIGRCRMSKDAHKVFRYPLIEDADPPMRRSDCIAWCKQRGFPGPARSACLCCPYHTNAEWRRIRDNYPEEFAAVAKFEKEIQSRKGERGLSFVGTPYLHRSLVPIDQVDLSTEEERGQGMLFECSGMCGT